VAEVETQRWWDDLRERSVGTMHIREWAYLWVTVMLRRVKSEGSLFRFRSIRSWERLINQQISPADPEGADFDDQTYNFLHATDCLWSILRRSGKYDYGIGRVATLHQDIEYVRAMQSKRMTEEYLLRLEADHKRELEKN
jgi:hypothetical protein